MNYVKIFEEKLEQTFGVVDRATVKHLGLRCISVSGDVCDYDVSPDFLPSLKPLLPEDAKVVRFVHSNITHFAPITDRCFYDRYVIIFCSKEWEAINPGERIPEIEPKFWRKENKPNSEIQAALYRDFDEQTIPNLITLEFARANLTLNGLNFILDAMKHSSKPTVSLFIKSIETEDIEELKTQLNQTKTQNLDKVTGLIELILNPKSSSSSVVELAQSIKDELNK